LPEGKKVRAAKMAADPVQNAPALFGRDHIVPAPDLEAYRNYRQEYNQYQQSLKPFHDSNYIHTYTV
jgi:hypothetical protein